MKSNESKWEDEGGKQQEKNRRSALGQVAKTHFALKHPHNSSAPRMGSRTASARRPASAVAGMGSGRPKSGGRPLTAQERRRRMPVGPSLSRSMSQLRASNSEKTLSMVQTKLDQAYMKDKAKNAEIHRLTHQLKEREQRNRQLEAYVGHSSGSGGSGGGKGGGGKGGSGHGMGRGKISPGSASILSEYSRASASGSLDEEVLVLTEPPARAEESSRAGDMGGGGLSGRQLLSPLNQKKIMRRSLRVG